MKLKTFIFGLIACFLTTSCSLTNAAKGGMIGGASGTAAGAAVGLLISKLAGTNTAKTTSIAAAAGMAVGATAGSLIGHKMDKAAKAAAALNGADAELLTDDMTFSRIYHMMLRNKIVYYFEYQSICL